jgi:hypothetical protein
VRLQAGHEEKEDDTELGERLEELADVQDADELRAQDGAGGQLADHPRQTGVLGQPPQKARHAERKDDLQKYLDPVHGTTSVCHRTPRRRPAMVRRRQRPTPARRRRRRPEE